LGGGELELMLGELNVELALGLAQHLDLLGGFPQLLGQLLVLLLQTGKLQGPNNEQH
jgi:hypothetical protein